jgi:hypothetical protein
MPDSTDQWYNQTLCKVKESVVRLGVLQGEYHWHKHDKEDEFFMSSRDDSLSTSRTGQSNWSRRQGFIVAKGVMHRTRAPERTIVLMVEPATVVPTGN